jgi:hypothetical protein
MTVWRRQRKLSALLAALFIFAPAAICAATTERSVVDRLTGLAISGYDPVAYFVEGRALPGKGEHEYAFAGGVWRFRNPGNRAAFIANPSVYMPRFGGYDPVGLTRGVTVPGNPRVWYVVGERLYLFYSLEAQAVFVLDADRLAATADRKWPSLRHQLAR